MPISAGTTLGSYEISTALGAGGMGEVYRARDTKLGRSVAIKVLPEAFAFDADRVARLTREARMLASLNHPRIAALHGMEQSEGRHFLVMELVEGETLADRLRRGPLPAQEALTVARQIAEALEAAHEKGLIHRDLKPANVKITPDDEVKVLDFGLAKAMDAEPRATSIADSPTLSRLATEAGIILGTAAYMSPEQAKGFPADQRSDIFSFGVVLFEMLTGRRPFQGETAAEVLASVIVRDPELASLPHELNPRIADLVRRCLEKQPKRRWQAIGDVRAEIEAILAAPAAISLTATPAPRVPVWRRAIPLVGIALLSGVADGTRDVEPHPITCAPGDYAILGSAAKRSSTSRKQSPDTCAFPGRYPDRLCGERETVRSPDVGPGHLSHSRDRKRRRRRRRCLFTGRSSSRFLDQGSRAQEDPCGRRSRDQAL